MTTPVYKSGSTVPVTVPLPLDGSDPLIPTAVSVTVRDETGVVITTLTPSLPVSGDTEITVEIAAGYNMLAANVRKAARAVEVVFTTAKGVFTDTAHYIVESNIQLVVLTNSFVTYPEALMVRTDIPTLNGWDAATDSARMAALMVAHWNMCAMRYRYRVGLAGQSRISDFGGTSTDPYGRVYAQVSDIRNTLDYEWAEFPDDFKTALKRAQVVEADVLLKGDPVGDKRRSGIVSERIGESAMLFRQVPEAQFAISRDAMNHLKGFLVHGVRIARA